MLDLAGIGAGQIRLLLLRRIATPSLSRRRRCFSSRASRSSGFGRLWFWFMPARFFLHARIAVRRRR